MFANERHHKDTLQQMEHKYFEEKVRLQQEASKKIAELAERAHSEAIRWIILELIHNDNNINNNVLLSAKTTCAL